MSNWKNRIWDLYFFISSICLGMGIGVLFVSYYPFFDSFSDSSPSFSVESPPGCENQSIENTSKCLVDYVDGFFIYNLTKGDNRLSEEELRAVGGDCSEWGLFYVDLAEELGFKAETFDFYNGARGHRIVIMWDENFGYCIISQTELIGCGRTRISIDKIVITPLDEDEIQNKS